MSGSKALILYVPWPSKISRRRAFRAYFYSITETEPVIDRVSQRLELAVTHAPLYFRAGDFHSAGRKDVEQPSRSAAGGGGISNKAGKSSNLTDSNA